MDETMKDFGAGAKILMDVTTLVFRAGAKIQTFVISICHLQEVRFWIRFMIWRDGPPISHPIDELLEYFKREQP